MTPYQERIYEGRKQFLKLALKQEQELLRIYEEAGKQVNYKLSKAKDGSLTKRYLEELEKSINQYVDELRYNLDQSIKNGIKASSQIATNVQLSYLDMVAPTQNLKGTFKNMFTQLPDRIVKQLISSNYYDDGKNLSQRLWNLTGKNGKDIDTLIKVNASKGANARDLAKQLESYINPENRIKPKPIYITDGAGKLIKLPPPSGISNNISYQAQRLARTSLTHAHNETYIQGTHMNPFCEGLKWNLSPSHYERQVARYGEDICDTYSGKIFKPQEYPVAHCNCLCYPTQEVIETEKARDELIAWMNGADNPKLDKWLEDYGEGFGIERNQSKIVDKIAVSSKKNSDIIKDNKVNTLVTDLKGLNPTQYKSRSDLGTDVLNVLDLKNIKVSVKPIQPNGYCSLEFRNGVSHVTEYVLDSMDKRGNNYKIKTAFHEAYHAKANGMKSDYLDIQKNWLEIEETFAETSAHFLIKQIGITEEIAPAYPEKLVNVLPRLKQLDNFKECSTLSDFGEVAWSERLNGVNPEWKELYNNCMGVSYNFNEYSKQYFSYIDEHKEELIDVMLNNMPEYVSYRDNMLEDCKKAMNNIENNTSLSSNQSMVFKNILAIVMNRLGVK